MPHEDMVASPESPYGMLTGGIGVRSDMLEELGMELPTNLDDFTAFLQAAKDQYDIAPLTANKSSPFISTILTAFGMGDAEWYARLPADAVQRRPDGQRHADQHGG